MESENKHILQTMIDKLQLRDNNAVYDMNGSLESWIWLADGRAVDALAAITTLAKYIMEKENDCNKKS